MRHLTKREEKVLALRQGRATFREIGERIGRVDNSTVPVSREAARALYLKALRLRSYVEQGGASALSCRTSNCLHNLGIDLTRPVEELKALLKEQILSGRIHPKAKIRNYGWKSHFELCAFVGLNIHEKYIRPGSTPGLLSYPFTCPNCGKDLICTGGSVIAKP